MREGGSAGVDIPPYEEGYNVADYLLDISSESPDIPKMIPGVDEKGLERPVSPTLSTEEKNDRRRDVEALSNKTLEAGMYVTTFLTQLQVLCGREWKILGRCAV